jgi:RNA polymerase sigma factor (sigma-70 family)
MLYNNRGLNLGGLSEKNPQLYRKIYGITKGDTEKNYAKRDVLDVGSTVPYESVKASVAPNQEDVVMAAQLKESVSKVLETLAPRYERVLRMRFGIGLDRSYNLYEIADHYGLGPERIRQMEAKALRMLKHPSRSRKIRPFV